MNLQQPFQQRLYPIHIAANRRHSLCATIALAIATSQPSDDAVAKELRISPSLVAGPDSFVPLAIRCPRDGNDGFQMVMKQASSGIAAQFTVSYEAGSVKRIRHYETLPRKSEFIIRMIDVASVELNGSSDEVSKARRILDKAIELTATYCNVAREERAPLDHVMRSNTDLLR